MIVAHKLYFKERKGMKKKSNASIKKKKINLNKSIIGRVLKTRRKNYLKIK